MLRLKRDSKENGLLVRRSGSNEALGLGVAHISCFEEELWWIAFAKIELP